MLTKRNAMWREGYIHAVAERTKFPTMNIPALYKTEKGYLLGKWMRTQVKMEASGKLKEERKEMLEGLGVSCKIAVKCGIV